MFPALVLYLVFAAGAAFLCHRFLRRLSLAAAAVLVLLPLALTGKALVRGEVYSPLHLTAMTEPLWSLREPLELVGEHTTRGGELAFQLTPLRKAVRYAIKNGEWPLWDPFHHCGSVLAGYAQSAPYHPIHLAGYLASLGQSLTYAAAATLFCAALAAFAMARELGCRESAALVAAAAWSFSSFEICWLGWPLGLAMAFLPLVLLGARRVAREPGPRATLLLALALGLVILAGHPETLVHAVAAGGVYGLYELLAARRRAAGARRRTARSLAAAVAGGVLALALCAFFLLPFLDALPQTEELARRAAEERFERGVPVAETLRRLRVNVLPFVYGLPWREAAPAPLYFEPTSSAYVGAVLFAPILFALRRGRWPGRWVLAGLGAVGALAAASAPGLTEVLTRLPLLEIAINKWLAAVAACAAALLAALGVEAWARAPTRALGGYGLATLAAVAALVAALWPGMRAAGLSAGFLAEQTAYALVPAALAAAVFLLPGRPRLAVPALLVLLVAQRAVETRDAYPSFPQRAFYPVAGVLEALPRDGSIYRVVGHGAAFLPNLSALYELEDPRGTTAMTFARLVDTYRLWSARPGAHFWNPVEDLEAPFLSFLNVRYAIVPRTLPVPAGWTVRAASGASRLLENPRVLPRVFVPAAVRLGEPEPRMWRQMTRQTDFSALAWIDDGGGAARPRERPNGPGTIAIERRGTGYLLDAEMAGAGWVVVSDAAWRGWRARANGETLATRFANHAFLAFHLPPGRHRVELVYRPRSFALGLATSGAALATLLAAGVWALTRRRRQASPVDSGPPMP